MKFTTILTVMIIGFLSFSNGEETFTCEETCFETTSQCLTNCQAFGTLMEFENEFMLPKGIFKTHVCVCV